MPSGRLNLRQKQVVVQKKVAKLTKAVKATPIHGRPTILLDPMFYPPHDARRESSGYKKAHKELTDKEDLPCLVCGVRKSTLKDPKENRFGATAMETHHHIVEWALANAIDPAKFNSALRPNLQHRHSNEPLYSKTMTREDIRDWIDHSPDNLWVLCDVHHRHRWLGIHAISYPLWCPQDMLDPSFVASVAKETAKADQKNRKTKGKPNKPATNAGKRRN